MKAKRNPIKVNWSPDHPERPVIPANGSEALRKSEARYRRLFEAAHDGILILDAETGAIADANPFLLDLLDYPLEELIGKHLWDIGEFKDIAASKAAFATLQGTEYVRYANLPLQTRSGDQRDVEFISNVYDVDGEKVIQCNIREQSRWKSYRPSEGVAAAPTRQPAADRCGNEAECSITQARPAAKPRGDSWRLSSIGTAR